MANSDDLISECRKLPGEIAAVAEAIVRFVSSESGDDWNVGDSGRWRPSSENPVTLKPQWKQARSLAVTLRGNPQEFEQGKRLELTKDQNGYSSFRLDQAAQSAEAFAYISRAYVIFERGRARSQTTPKTVG